MTTAALLDRTFDALANEHRRGIVDRLVAGPIDTPALGAHFDISRQALNKHLMQLEEAGLIERRLRGRVHRVYLRTRPLDSLTDWVSEINRAWAGSLDRLGEILDAEAP